MEKDNGLAQCFFAYIFLEPLIVHEVKGFSVYVAS